MITKKVMLIYSSVEGNGKGGNLGNNNKFYYIELHDDGTVIGKNGRIGTSGVPQPKGKIGEVGFEKLKKSKIKTGYKEAEIDLDCSDNNKSIKIDNLDIMSIALSQIDSDKESKDLIEKLVKKNIHNITSNTQITFNFDTGIFKTPLGVVSKNGVEKAKVILDKIIKRLKAKTIKQAEIITLNEEYFTIIPTIIKDMRNYDSLITTEEKVLKQYDICDTLLQTIEIVEEEKKKQIEKQIDNKEIPKVFDTSIKLLTDKKEFKRIEKYFEKSKNDYHGYKTSNSKIKNIYTINIHKEEKDYKYDMKNQMELWHGTKLANILSILKSGLLMPNLSPGQVTGHMFGKGLYFSDQSSKSLNYCDGMYWNNSKSENKIYLFLADIAMGNYQIPNGSTSSLPSKGYDSYFAKADESRVKNNEMIIFNKNQIRLKYLIEIELP